VPGRMSFGHEILHRKPCCRYGYEHDCHIILLQDHPRLSHLRAGTQVKPRHNTGLPNETWCSDHIALLAEFAFRQS